MTGAEHWIHSEILLIGWLLEFYVLETCRVISSRVPTYDSEHWWQLYSAAPLWNQAASTMTRLHNLDNELTSPYPMSIMLNTRVGSKKYQFLSHCFDSTGDRTSDPPDVRPAFYRFGHCARCHPIEQWRLHPAPPPHLTTPPIYLSITQATTSWNSAINECWLVCGHVTLDVYYACAPFLISWTHIIVFYWITWPDAVACFASQALLKR